MKHTRQFGPQHSMLFKVVGFFSRLQLQYRLRSLGSQRVYIIIFVFAAGATAISIITLIAILTELPLLFPPLGPSAFILFYTPMSRGACPRNVFLSHSMAVIAGLLSLWGAGIFCVEANLGDLIRRQREISVNWRALLRGNKISGERWLQRHFSAV